MRVGADTGGTFTDLVAEDGRVAKVLSTPDDPGRALREGLTELGADRPRPALLAHGTTVPPMPCWSGAAPGWRW
jgi:N-methylhydantoinase A